MAKAFLSHSSKDKSLVERVFRELNAAKVHYDAVTFESGKTSAQNVADAMSDTDLFVLFVSKDSMRSEWVQHEIQLARKAHGVERLVSLLVFVIDDTPFSKLPDWIRDFTAARIKSPKLIALRIMSRLTELELDRGARYDVFVGRNDLRREIQSALSAGVEHTPSLVCLNGWHGVGRRTLLRKSLSETFPWLPRLLPQVHLKDDEGASECYRAVLDVLGSRSADEWRQILSDFDCADRERQAELLADAVTKISSLKQLLIVKGNLALVNENGDLRRWVRKLVSALPPQNMPYLSIICSRRVRPHNQAKYRQIAFFSVNSLSYSESLQLLGALLKRGSDPVPSAFLESVTPLVSGHPQNIHIASEFARRLGLAAFEARKREFSRLFTERANRLVQLVLEPQQGAPDTQTKKKILMKLLEDFDYLAADELLSFFETSEIPGVQAALNELEDFSVLEWEGRFLRLAPFVSDAVRFSSWEKETKPVRAKATKEIIERTSKYVDEEGVRLSVVSRASLAVLRKLHSGEAKIEVSHGWLQDVALPSHYLRVAREVYDDRKEQTAIELTKKVLSFKRGLTEVARIEALRLKGMCHARLGQADGFFSVVEALESMRQRVARRNARFLRGFRLRKRGKFYKAEQEYKKAYQLDLRNFHVLRELAHVLLLQDKFAEAKNYAERAVERHPSNSYALDTLVGATIGGIDDSQLSQRQADFDDLFARLEEACAFDKTSFFEIQRAYFLARLGKFEDAFRHAKAARQKTPNLFAANAVAVNVALMAKDVGRARAAIRDIDRLARDDKTGEAKDPNQLAKMRVRFALLSGDTLAARSLLERTYVSQRVFDQLDGEISTAMEARPQKISRGAPISEHTTKPRKRAPQFGKGRKPSD